MIKIVCDKDDKESAEKIVKLVQEHQICPPFVDCSPAASCDQCIAEWLEIEVIKGMTELERLKEQVEHERLKDEKERAINEIEERKAFNLKCDGQPEWLRKGIDVGLNTALDILKRKER